MTSYLANCSIKQDSKLSISTEYLNLKDATWDGKFNMGGSDCN